MILLAADFGQRMCPVTLERPKPPVSVNGTIMIETRLDALMEKGIRVRVCTATDIVKIDSVAELAAVDHSYDQYP